MTCSFSGLQKINQTLSSRNNQLYLGLEDLNPIPALSKMYRIGSRDLGAKLVAPSLLSCVALISVPDLPKSQCPPVQNCGVSTLLSPPRPLVLQLTLGYPMCQALFEALSVDGHIKSTRQPREECVVLLSLQIRN